MKTVLTMSVALVVATPALAKDRPDPAQVVAWTDCLKAGVDRFTSSGEPVDTVITAAFGSCRAEDEAVYDLRVHRPFAMRLLTGPADRQDQEAATKDQELLRARFRDQLTSYILEARAASGKLAH